MAIPAFGGNGMLPLGDYFGEHESHHTYVGWDSTYEEVHERFVIRYPDSATRHTLFHEVRMFCGIAVDLCQCVNFLISGTFITDIDDPTDVFLVLEIEVGRLDVLGSSQLWLLHRLFNSREAVISEHPLSVFTELVRRWPDNHPRHDEGNAERLHALYLAGRPTDDKDEPAGHVEIFDCPQGGDHVDEVLATPTSGDSA